MTTHQWKLALMLSAAGLLGACQGKSGGAAATEAPPTSQSAGGAPTAPPSEAQSSPVGAPAAAPANKGAFANQALDLQKNHPNGVVLRVTGIQFTDATTSLTLSVTNGKDSRITLNDNSNNNMILRDNLGNVYRLVPPPTNADVAVEAQKSLEGTFSFAGRLDPGAASAALVTNSKYGSTDNEYTNTPRIEVEIPLKK